jgi:hypothetical protein
MAQEHKACVTTVIRDDVAPPIEIEYNVSDKLSPNQIALTISEIQHPDVEYQESVWLWITPAGIDQIVEVLLQAKQAIEEHAE